MNVEAFAGLLGADFYTGVPDSQLRGLCDYLMDVYGTNPRHHVIAANEGNCVALAAGYHLATGNVPVVYLQNSGEGNILNPVASLLNSQVYGIPMLFVIGWRGEPGLPDEPQHKYQGSVTLRLLEDMGVASSVLGPDGTAEEAQAAMAGFRPLLGQGRQAAFVVRKHALRYEKKGAYANQNKMRREDVIRRIAAVAGEDVLISTTGKASRELFEARELNGQSHERDFLTVGSMGHSSSIALGVALHAPGKKIWCIDGDGAVLMHMGAMAAIGWAAPENMVHVVINNEAHESVGGMPTAAKAADLTAVAGACGYGFAVCVDNAFELEKELKAAKARKGLSFLEVKCAIGARADLGRPTLGAADNKRQFMDFLKKGVDKSLF